jgi:hypothetical protein
MDDKCSVHLCHDKHLCRQMDISNSNISNSSNDNMRAMGAVEDRKEAAS